MTFKMAWGRQVGLCIKFIWNLHFDWPTVWANSTVTYRSDRDIWQSWTIAEMAFKTQPVRAGEIFPERHLIHLPSAPPPPQQPWGGCQWSQWRRISKGARWSSSWSLPPLFFFTPPHPPPPFHPWSHQQALFLLVKSTVVSGSACSRQMETVSMSPNDQSGIFWKCSLISVTPALDAEPGITLVPLLLSET